MMRVTVLSLAVGISMTLPALQHAQAQNPPGLPSIVQPLEPERELGLPTMAPPAAELPAPSSPPPRVRQAAPAREAAPQDEAAPEAAATPPAPAPAPQYGEWKTECLEAEDAGTNCQAIVRAMAGDQVALVLGIAKPAAGEEARMQMAVPLGLSVQKGVTVTVGEFSGEFPISRCTAQGCLVEGEAPEALIEAFRASSAGSATIYTMEGQAIELPLPAMGFTKTYAAINEGG